MRDFVYLDAERIRSFVAQASKGLVSERVEGTEQDAGSKAGGKAGIPLVAELAGQIDYRYVRTSSETRSLHDHIFEELYRHLQESDKLHEPDPNWREGSFVDGQFLEVSGRMKLVDFQGAVDTISIFPTIVEIASKASAVGGPQADQKARQQAQALSQQAKAMPIKQVAAFVKEWYGEDVRLKLYPFSDSPERVLVGRAARSLFRYSPATLIATYGRMIDAGWRALVHVHKGSHHEAAAPPMQGQQQLDDIMEGLTEVVAGFSTAGVQFPAVAVTPLAIYRLS